MQFGRSGRVLQQGLSCGMHDGGCAKGSQGSLMKAAQDELLFAGVGVDVADGKDAGHIGGKGFGVDHQLLALHRQAPVGNRAELGREA